MVLTSGGGRRMPEFECLMTEVAEALRRHAGLVPRIEADLRQHGASTLDAIAARLQAGREETAEALAVMLIVQRLRLAAAVELRFELHV